MTLEDWLRLSTPGSLSTELSILSDRKIHLLTAAFLRRVWDHIPEHHTRIAVEATEKFADGRVTVDELARLRSADLLESVDPLWADDTPDSYDEDLIGLGCGWCPVCEPRAVEYECRVARNGYILHGVKAGVEQPGWVAGKSAFHARELLAWAVDPEERDEAVRSESVAQFNVYRDIVGGWADPRWKYWRSHTVRLIARGIHRDRTFDQLPILADALEEASCDDAEVLSHCREARDHVRGCWVLDLAMGVS